MGIFNYVVQGFGWEVGSEVAREAIGELKQADRKHTAEEERAAIARERAELARERAELARRKEQRTPAPAKRSAKSPEIAAELAALKRKMSK